VGSAQSNSTIPFSSTSIVVKANELVNQNDIIMALPSQMTAAINANNTSLAVSLVQSIRSALNKQSNKSTSIISEIETIKNNIRRYTVCLFLVDNQGNQAIDGGFGAQNTETGEIIYPGDPNAQYYGYENCFINLPAVTYEFFSFPSQGSLCGTGSQTVTLSPSLVNSNGVVEITMVTWCE
jgi:hypothetical protein